MKLWNKNNWHLLVVSSIYVILTIICINDCYFWDTIQQVSKEAHWYFLSDFSSLLIPATQHISSDIIATGYHPPLMGIMIAALWKIIGYKLWVSHVFILLWGFVLIYNIWKIVKTLFPENLAGWVLLIILLEPTLLSQFSIASPDFILFTAFVISLRAILNRKSWQLCVGIFFLCCINMRGIFAGGILFMSNIVFVYLQTHNIRSVYKTALPYFPTFILLVAYFSYYFINHGWFFNNSADSFHYSLPGGVESILKHLAEFGLRSIENGRFVIWVIGIFAAFNYRKLKEVFSPEYKIILAVFLLLTGLYLFFVFFTQMPFSARYFMPQFFLLTLMALTGITNFLEQKKLKIVVLIILCFELTGHFWIYPDKIAKSWDCTLAHLPYYELRKNCFQYIDHEKLDYRDISAGFCLYGNRRFTELGNINQSVGTRPDNKYFIYSNISNLEDSFADELKNKTHWIPIRSFEEGFVVITIYKNLNYKN